MARRSYHQFCALARSLDLLGERWTLLIVRELLLGPRRYGEILQALPGIGTNLLAERLTALVSQSICRRDGRLYELSERGLAIEEAVLALARWGMDPLAEPRAGEQMRPEWYALAMQAAFRPGRGAIRDEAYEFEIDDEVFHLGVRDGVPTARRGQAEAPAFRLTSDLPTFLAIVTRRLRPPSASIDGEREAVGRWLGAFSLPVPVG